MSQSTCNVRIVTKEQKLICLITVEITDTVEIIKQKIVKQSLKKNSNFQLYYNKVYLMKDTVIRDLHPGSDTFSLDIDYGTDYEYSFVLEDGSVRRARVNSLDTFFDITRIAACSLGISEKQIVVLCDNIVPIPIATPSSYGYTSHCFQVLLLKDNLEPNIIATIKKASVSGDLLLCYSSLAYFLNKDAPYTCLTNLALITRNALSDINSIIPSKMDILLIFLIHSMLNERITPEELEKNPISSKDNRFLFLESIYSCVFMLVKRYLYMKIPIKKDLISFLLHPIELYSKTVGNSNRMSVIRSSATSNKTPSIFGELVSICVQTLELYCNADDLILYPQYKTIAEVLLTLTKGSVSTAVYAKVLSCLCGLCRNNICMDQIVNSFSIDSVASLITDCENVPAIVRTLFLIYAFIMEKKEMPVEDRNQIIDVATEYLNRHGDELPLLEAYILLVIPAYQGKFSSLPQQVAVKLESALQYSEESEVIHTWITRLLSGYFSILKEDAMDYYIQQAYTIFITLHDIPLDSAAVQRGVQSLQVYCLSPILRDVIITVNSMHILVMLLYTNIQHDTNSVIPIASLLKDLLNGNSVGIDMFLDNHGLDFICDEIDCIKRVETVLALYDLMIVVFREVSPNQLPSFSIDVFKTIETFNNNKQLITKGMTILSLFNRLQTNEIEQKVSKLLEYLLTAMSSHNYYLVSIIIYILSKMDLNDAAYQVLEKNGFLQNVILFIDDFSSRLVDGSETTSNEHFTNIVYYMLGFIDDHFSSKYVTSCLDMKVLVKWVNMYKVDRGIVNIWLEIVEKCIEGQAFHLNDEIETMIVTFLLDIICIFSEKSIYAVNIQMIAFSILLDLLSGYSDYIIERFKHPFFQEALHTTLSYILDIYCTILQLDVTVSSSTHELSFQPLLNSVRIDLTSSKSSNEKSSEEEKPVAKSPSSMYCINFLPRNKHSLMMKRRHCLSRSVNHSQQHTLSTLIPTVPAVSKDSIRINEIHEDLLSEEERKYDWDSCISHILQFLSGIMAKGEAEHLSLQSFTRLLSYLYGIYQYIYEKNKKSFRTKSILDMLENMLVSYCNVTLQNEQVPMNRRFSDIEDRDSFGSNRESLGQRHISLGKRKDGILRVSVYGG